MDNKLKYGNRVLKALSYIDAKINPDKYVQKGGVNPTVLETPKIIDYKQDVANKKSYIKVQINNKLNITFTITKK
jgi:hypothetical protein